MIDVEDVVEKIIELLEAEMPTALMVIETEKNDGIALEPVARFYFGERFIDRVVSANAPVATVSPERSTSRNVQSSFSDDEETIVITVILRGDKEETITRKALRYARAVKRVLNSHPVVGLVESGDVKCSAIDGIDYSPITRSGGLIFMGVDVRFKVGMIGSVGN